jgi:transposase
MINFIHGVNVIFIQKSIDFRKGMDSLSSYCRNILKKDPMSGCIFVFRNKQKTCLRILFYDGQGFWLSTKRMSQGKFKIPSTEEDCIDMDIKKLQILLLGCDLDKAIPLEDWRKIT